ncbi:hypothetical protein J6R97_04135 [bacterium]|nr:hypothetical protein [bacterium]
MTTSINGIEFDPGFAPYILAFQGSVEYLYMDINRFKNLSQKKLKFMQYYKKMIEILNNNLGFYVGCLMWALYIKTQPKQKLLSNHCLGLEYDEEANISETKFILQFMEKFPKDIKYYLGQDYKFDENLINLVKIYEEFLIINKGFVNSENNTDIELPTSIKTEEAENHKTLIEKVLEKKDLSKLLEYLPIIL